MSYINVKDLCVGYESKTVASGINFAVNPGDYLCILGENGGGKSTLMKTLLGLLSPISGSIEFGDGLKSYETGYLPQSSQIQKDFPASVREIVLSGTLCTIKGGFFYKKKQQEIAAYNMKRMDVYNLRRKSFANLSGGQQQRVLLARTLCAAKKLILLDEPVTGLDPKVTLDFYDVIKSLNEEGISIIMISHDLKASMKYASHILHLNKKQLFFGTKSEYENSHIYSVFEQEETVYE